MMKRKIVPLILSATLGIAFQAAQAEIKPLNRIAMEVNSSVITYRDIERTVRELKSRNAGQNIPEEQFVQAAKQRLLERALIADAARQQQLKATDSGIDEELKRRAALEHTTVENLYKKAQANGYTREAYRLEVAKDVLADYLLSDLNNNVNIRDAQINEALQSGAALPQGTPYTVYTIRRIILQAGSQANMSAVENRMQQIAQAIQQGSDFAAIAKRYSQEAEAVNVGLHEVSDDMLPENVEKLIHQMQPNQITAPQRVGTSWQIVQLVSSRTENDPAKMQREAVRRQLVQQARQANQAQFVQQLQQNAVVREY